MISCEPIAIRDFGNGPETIYQCTEFPDNLDTYKPPTNTGSGGSSSGVSYGGQIYYDPLNPSGSVPIATQTAPEPLPPNVIPAWDAGAYSAEKLPANWLGTVLFDVPDVQGTRPGGVAIGLVPVANLPTVGRSGYAQIKYGLVFTSATVRIILDGSVAREMTYAEVNSARAAGSTTDTVALLVGDGHITYVINDTLYFSGAFSMPSEFALDATLYTPYDEVDNPEFAAGAWTATFAGATLTGALSGFTMEADARNTGTLSASLQPIAGMFSMGAYADLRASMSSFGMTSSYDNYLQAQLPGFSMRAYSGPYAALEASLPALNMQGGVSAPDASVPYSMLASSLSRFEMQATLAETATLDTAMSGFQMRALSEASYSELNSAMSGLRMTAYSGGVTPFVNVPEFVGVYFPSFQSWYITLAITETVGGGSTITLQAITSADATEQITAEDQTQLMLTFLHEALEQIGPLQNTRMTVLGALDEVMFSRSRSTQDTYESRIDALFAGAEAARVGARVLDRSDMLGLLGYADQPVVLAEGKVRAGQVNHQRMTAQTWKKVPEWLENPAAVFASDTVPGRLVFIAPEMVNGSPVRMIVEPNTEVGGLQVHLLINAFDATGRTPWMRWASDGLIKYLDKKKFPGILAPSGLQLSRVEQASRGTGKILTEKDLAGWRKANNSAYSHDMSDALASELVKLGAAPATKDSVHAAVRQLVNGLGLLPNRLGRVVVATSDEIKRDWEPLVGAADIESSGEAGLAQGFYDPKSRTVFLIADHIREGQEMAVVAHELMHKHGQAVLGEEGWNRLHGMIGGWAKAEPGSMERRVYDEAAQRVRASRPQGADVQAYSSQELFPYAVQVALEMGVRPNLMAKPGTVARWLGQVRAALRQVWDKITRKPELFKTQDMVNLAFGIAQRENPEHAGELDGAISDVERGIQTVIDAARSPGHAPQKVVIGQVSDWLAQEAENRMGLKVAGFTHTLDGSAARHMLNRHSNPAIEKSRGQIALTDEDIRAAAQIVTQPDRVVLGTQTQGHKDQIVYLKRQDDGSILYLEEVRTGRQELAAVSMRKYPAARDFSDIIATLPSNARSDGGDGFIVLTSPGASNGAIGRTETPAFKRWFAGSKAVDAQGQPLRVFHGTGGDFSVFTRDRAGATTGAANAGMGFFFTDRPEVAGNYARAAGSAQSIMPVYLSLQNPLRLEASNMMQADKLLEAELQPEHDGAIVEVKMRDGGTQQVFMVRESTQVKSATGNNGQFSSDNPDIRFSRSVAADSETTPTGRDASWDTPAATKFDDLVYKLQDKHIDTKRVIEAITGTGKAIADDLNVYLQEELFHGRTAKRTQDFVQKEVQPLMEFMQRSGLTMDQVEEYLHARHAREANAVIARRNPNLPDGGSGMTNAEADAVLSGVTGMQRFKLEKAAKMVDAIIDGTRETIVGYGLENADTVKGWTDTFKNYVPLQREDKEGRMGIGQGFSVKGREVKGRTGSTRKVVDILANVVMQRERAIVRGEKNRVAVALVGLAKDNPNADLWAVDVVPTTQVLDKKTGMVTTQHDPLYKNRDNAVVAKINGEEHVVTFNEDDPRAMRMAEALKNLDAAQLEGLLGATATATRYLAAVNTQYNPIFGVTNLVRDVQESMLNLSSTPLAGKQGQVLGGTFSAVGAILKDERARRKGTTTGSEWAKWWEEFQDVGGQTGYRDMFRNSADRAKELQKTLTPDGWAETGWGKFITAGGVLKAPMEIVRKRAAPLFDLLEDYNTAMENGVRLSAYKTARNAGMSKEQAASLAKSLTVNFNRKGAATQQIGALYAFFNASVQGTARMGQTLFDMEAGKPKTIRLSKVGKNIVFGGMLIGSMQALMLAAAGFGDDEPPEFIRERNLIIPTGGKTYISIPMPLGFHVIANLGRIPTEFALGGGQDAAKHFASLLNVMADVYNPLGSTGLSMQTLAPTVLDPFAALAENKDSSGRPIAKMTFNKVTPGHALAKDTASLPATWLAQLVNYATGGTAHTRGELSPTPDQIDYLVGQVTGGVGREATKFLQTGQALLAGDSVGDGLPWHKVPLMGRFFGDADSDSSKQSAFYNRLDAVRKHAEEVKGLRADGKGQEAMAYVQKHPEARYTLAANAAERQIRRMRERRRELEQQGAARGLIRDLDRQMTQRMEQFSALVAR